MDPAAIYNVLQKYRYAVVSSISPTGYAQSALVGIAVTPKLEIIFDTLRTTRKYPNLIARPACSLVIGWENQQTVQLEGIAFEPQTPELAHYQQTYFAAWPDGRQRISWPEIAWFVVRPNWIRFSDYNEATSQIVEVAIPSGL